MEKVKAVGSALLGIAGFLFLVLCFVLYVKYVNHLADNLDCPKGDSVAVNYFGPENGPAAECVK